MTTGGAGVWALAGLLPPPRGRHDRAPVVRPAWLAPERPDVAGLAELRELAMRALDAAKRAGAEYADVRLTYTRERRWVGLVEEQEELAVGVRALVDGQWGFASCPFWTSDVVSWLGEQAVVQARAIPHTTASARSSIELVPTPAVSGDWQTPVTIDPFAVAVEELTDWFNGMGAYGKSFVPLDPNNMWNAGCPLAMWRQQQAFASTDGSYTTQTLTRTSPQAQVTVNIVELVRQAPMWGDFAGGLEIVYDNEMAVREWFQTAVDDLKRVVALPVRPVDVGRYDVLLDAATTAACLASSLGDATQLDRAVGLEANASGTSFLGPNPLTALGSAVVAAPAITITANRSSAGDLATVQWDGEGVAPQEVTLVNDGVFANYQIARGQAAMVAPYYQKHGATPRPSGYVSAPSALDLPLQHTPNLRLRPATDGKRLSDLIASTDNGVLYRNGTVDMDFQRANGWLTSTESIRVMHGRAVARMKSAGTIFKTTDFWKTVHAMGGDASEERTTVWSEKGEPARRTPSTVRSVPVVAKDAVVIDVTRRA